MNNISDVYQQLNSTPCAKQNENIKDTKDLLRLSDEPCIYIGEYQVHKTLIDHTTEFMNSMKDFYKKWGNKSSLVHVPVKQVFKTSGLRGDFRVMPCIIKSEEHIKSIKVIGTNEENSNISDKICVGKSLLIDRDDNYVYAILDVCALSSYRTAAVSVLAFSVCCEVNNTKVGLIGLGRIGFYHLFILHTWLGIDNAYCYDKDKDALERLQKLVEMYIPQMKLKIVSEEVLIEKSNAVFLSTDSESSILYQHNSEHLGFISSVGADADNLSELDSSILSTSHQLVTDSLQSLLLGDMQVWKNKGLLIDDDVLELKDIINGHKKGMSVVFISTGIAVQDALISKFVTDKIQV